MIDRRHAEEALEQLSIGITGIIEDAFPVTVDAVINGDRRREDLLAEAGEDVLTLVRAMRVFRRRMVDAPPVQEPADGD
ncbi:MAG: hypothetical protein EOP19_10900 [Hyphomicrobiales bacterium]|nr:MAG: hypothetical protein EOP19_10900 [Hyphomicrobiales bacterium]